MFIVAIAAFLVSYSSQMTILHQACIKGDQASCVIEKRENIVKK